MLQTSGQFKISIAFAFVTYCSFHHSNSNLSNFTLKCKNKSWIGSNKIFFCTMKTMFKAVCVRIGCKHCNSFLPRFWFETGLKECKKGRSICHWLKMIGMPIMPCGSIFQMKCGAQTGNALELAPEEWAPGQILAKSKPVKWCDWHPCRQVMMLSCFYSQYLIVYCIESVTPTPMPYLEIFTLAKQSDLIPSLSHVDIPIHDVHRLS